MIKIIFKKYFHSKHLLISFCGTVFGIFSTVVLFFYSVFSNEELIIAQFSIFLLIFFGTSILCMIGNDLEILAKSRNLNRKEIIIDEKVFKLLISAFINIFLYFLYSNNLDIFVIEFPKSSLLLIHIAILLNNFNKTFQSYIQSSSKLLANSIIDFSRYTGYFIFLIYWILDVTNELSLIFIIGELLTLISILIYLIFNAKNVIYVKKKLNIDLNYIFLSISQFSYQSLFKIDILTISILGNARLVILYAILSNVIEGIVNFITTFHASMNNFILRNKNKQVTPTDTKNYLSVNKIVQILILLIFPSYLIFNYLVFFEFPKINFMLIVFLLSLSIFLSKKLFLFYYIYSLYENPVKQFIFSLGFLLTNFILNIILFKYLGIAGIALSTSFSYLFFNFIIEKEIKNKKFRLK